MIFLQPRSVRVISSQLARYRAPGIMLQACRIITVWVAWRTDRQWMKLACVLIRRRAFRS